MTDSPTIQYKPTISSPINCDFGDFYYFNDVFTEELIEKTHKMIVLNRYVLKKGETGYGENTDSEKTNNRDIAYVPYVDHSEWVYKFLLDLVLQANKEIFQFDIQTITDNLHYVIYPTDGGHLDWHMDIGQGKVNNRKLACTVQLSDPNDYEGGDFQVWYGGHKGFITLPREKGDVLIFPTFYLHRVTPITKGERRALVFWTGGEPFR